MMAIKNSRISYFGNIARLKKAIHTHRESDSLCIDEIESKSCFYDKFNQSKQFTSDSKHIWSSFEIFIITVSSCHHCVITDFKILVTVPTTIILTYIII